MLAGGRAMPDSAAMTTPAHAALIEASLELAAERCADPTPLVYARLFAAEPELEPYFWRDTSGTIRGEMLSKVFEAILDFVGPRTYAHQLITTEMVNHEGFDVPREVFATFFGIVAEAVAEIAGSDWTAEMAEAWAALLAEIDAYVQVTPRSDVVTPAFPSYNARKAAAQG
jgi:hemoglobin-like flavoprotein